METSKSNFLIGLAIGSAIGALAQRFSRTAKAKMLKKKIHNAMAKIADRAESLTENRERTKHWMQVPKPPTRLQMRPLTLPKRLTL